jgi:hypothetical protein
MAVARRLSIVAALLALGLVAAWGAVQCIGMSLGHPEVSNPADAAAPSVPARPEPEFVVSDRSLLRQDGVLIRERSVGSTGQGLDGAPYFLQISDGRYAYGFADAEGWTHPIRVGQPLPYEVFWYDDAWKQRQALAEKVRRGASAPVVVEGPRQR